MARIRDYKAEYQRRLQLRAAKGTKRDYKAEYQRSKQLAEKRGYQSVRAAKRSSRIARTTGTDLSKVKRAKEWSNARAVTDRAQYHPENAERLGLTTDEYTDIYLAAWEPYYDYGTHWERWNDAMKLWWDVNDFDDKDEMEDRYKLE